MILKGARFEKLPDDTLWPTADTGDLEWVLRYGHSTERVRYVAASYVAAYRELLGATSKRRAYVVREIRKACR